MPVPFKKANPKRVLTILNVTGFILLCIGGELIFIFLLPQTIQY